jgi:hypothetical protein
MTSPTCWPSCAWADAGGGRLRGPITQGGLRPFLPSSVRKLAAARILLIPILLIAVVAVPAVERELEDQVGEASPLDPIIDSYESPNDTAQIFCNVSDPSPWPDANEASLVLQDCAAGKTYTLQRGKTIAVDLSTYGFTGFTIHDLTVSDSSILQTVTAPRTVSTFGDYFAVYRGVRSGRVDINAVWSYCGNGCSDSMRWEAIVQVT